MTITEVKRHYYQWECPQCGMNCKQDIQEGEDRANSILKCWNCRHEINNGLSDPKQVDSHPFDSLKKEAI